MNIKAAAAGAVVVLAVAVTARAQEPPPAKKPLTHETLWLMKRVGSPAVSPDGRWVVFSVSEPAYDEKKEVSDLWIVLRLGGGFGDAKCRSPRTPTLGSTTPLGPARFARCGFWRSSGARIGSNSSTTRRARTSALSF